MTSQAKIWDYYQTRDRAKFDGSTPRLSYLAALTPKNGPLLDVGVGAGQFERAALAYGRDVHSLDSSEGAIQRIASELGLGDKARVGSVEQIPFPDAYFACVVMSEVLEHLDDDVLERGLAEVHRVLEPGGVFIGTVPARERLEESVVYCPTCNANFHRWGHVRSYSVESMRESLASQFRVEAVYEHVFVGWRTLNWKGRVVAALQSTSNKLGVRTKNASIVFRAARPW
jgi:SAM-dependent methyltransferase